MNNSAIVKTSDLPIKHEGKVHDGKVRSVYWLSEKESEILANKGIGRYNSQKAVMVISDRISAFDRHIHCTGKPIASHVQKRPLFVEKCYHF